MEATETKLNQLRGYKFDISSLTQINYKQLAKDLNWSEISVKEMIFRKIFSSQQDKTVAIKELVATIKDYDSGHDAYFILWDSYKNHGTNTEYLAFQEQVVKKWMTFAKNLDVLQQLNLEIDDDYPVCQECALKVNHLLEELLEKAKLTKLPKRLIKLRELFVETSPHKEWTTTKSIRNSAPGYDEFSTGRWNTIYEEVSKIWREASEEAFSKITPDNYFSDHFLLTVNNLHHGVDIYGGGKVKKMFENWRNKAKNKICDPDTSMAEIKKIYGWLPNHKDYHSLKELCRDRIIASYFSKEKSTETKQEFKGIREHVRFLFSQVDWRTPDTPEKDIIQFLNNSGTTLVNVFSKEGLDELMKREVNNVELDHPFYNTKMAAIFHPEFHCYFGYKRVGKDISEHWFLVLNGKVFDPNALKHGHKIDEYFGVYIPTNFLIENRFSTPIEYVKFFVEKERKVLPIA